MMTTTPIKATLLDDGGARTCRRLRAATRIDEMRTALKTSFALAAPPAAKWTDSEGDLIALETQADLDEAVRLCDGGLLRIVIEPTAETAEALDAVEADVAACVAEEVLKAVGADVAALPDALARRRNAKMPVWTNNGRHLFHSEGQWWIGDCVGLQRGYLLIEGCDSGDPRQLDLTETVPMVWQRATGAEEWLLADGLTLECSEELDDSGMPATVTVGGTSGIESCDERLLGAYTLAWRKGPRAKGPKAKAKAKTKVVKPTPTPEGADGLPETGIAMGAFGPGVVQLQAALSDAADGELTFATPGYFGPPTRDALKALQRRTDGLRASGTLDAPTRQWLLDRKTPSPATTGTTRLIGLLPAASFEQGPSGWCSTYEIKPEHFAEIAGVRPHQLGDVMEVRGFSIAGDSPMVGSIGTLQTDGPFAAFRAEGHPAALLRGDGHVVRGHCTSAEGGHADALRLTSPIAMDAGSVWCVQVCADQRPTAAVEFACQLVTPIVGGGRKVGGGCDVPPPAEPSGGRRDLRRLTVAEMRAKLKDELGYTDGQLDELRARHPAGGQFRWALVRLVRDAVPPPAQPSAFAEQIAVLTDMGFGGDGGPNLELLLTRHGGDIDKVLAELLR